LEESSDIQRENSHRLVGAWEGMRHELLELKVRMMQERFGQRVLSRGQVEEEDGDGRGSSHVPVVPFLPPQSLLQPTPMECAFTTQPGPHGVDPGFAYHSVPLQYLDHHSESHILQNPQGCRWHNCPVCRCGGERGVWFE
jgi:hypothetical protein